MKVFSDIQWNPCPQANNLFRMALLSAVSLVCVAQPPITKPRASTTTNYTATDQSFSISVPKDWKQDEKGHPYGDLTPIFGVRLTGPVGADDVAVTISVLHYSGAHLFRTPDEFIHNKLNSMARIDYDRKAAITATRVAGRTGKAFHIKTFKLVFLPGPAMPPMRDGIMYELSPPHKQIDMLEQYLVIPASKGYFVLGYSAPEKMVEEYRATFDKMVGSFHGHLP